MMPWIFHSHMYVWVRSAGGRWLFINAGWYDWGERFPENDLRIKPLIILIEACSFNAYLSVTYHWHLNILQQIKHTTEPFSSAVAEV